MLTSLDPSSLADAFNAILGASSLTYGVVIALSTIFFGIMRSMLPNEALAIIYLPFLGFSGLASPYLLRLQGISFTHEVYANTVVLVTIGMAFTLVVLLLLTRACYALSAKRALKRPTIEAPTFSDSVDLRRVIRVARDE